MQPNDFGAVLKSVTDTASEIMAAGPKDLNDLLAAMQDDLEDAIDRMEAGDYWQADRSARRSAAHTLLIASAIYRMASNVPAAGKCH
ncbi:hypothetical protein D3W54_06935 [Komagataeibacter medellinensis]|uniref:Phage protein n=1 Tax=Komagataeibacter medellinensis TaxID=1177712 RepID=A0ABQ6VUU8_9PROT|nr:hypothetical protein [Komagataeibacter medellinensis]KAB8123977.1 hypothetical protein D3W54_06935 [Komagataeibacter medellinensis]